MSQRLARYLLPAVALLGPAHRPMIAWTGRAPLSTSFSASSGANCARRCLKAVRSPPSRSAVNGRRPLPRRRPRLPAPGSAGRHCACATRTTRQIRKPRQCCGRFRRRSQQVRNCPWNALKPAPTAVCGSCAPSCSSRCAPPVMARPWPRRSKRRWPNDIRTIALPGSSRVICAVHSSSTGPHGATADRIDHGCGADVQPQPYRCRSRPANVMKDRLYISF
jgi:hypothetical protein